MAEPKCTCWCHTPYRGMKHPHPNAPCPCHPNRKPKEPKPVDEERRRAACRTPDKRWYRTKAEVQAAEQEMRQNTQVNSDLKPYLCDCGFWHLGHGKKRLGARINYALNRERYKR